MGTPKKMTVAKAGGKGAAKVARSRSARRTVKPAAKASWIVGKKVAKRKVSRHTSRYGGAARSAWSATLIYGPMVAKALGLVEEPKPRRRLPPFLAGIAVGAGLVYLFGRDRTA